MTVLTPTIRQGTRKSLFWVGVLVFLLLAAVGSLLLVGAANDTVPLSPGNPAPDGAMAVASVLEQEGVDVAATSSLADTADAVGDPRRTTLVVHDPGALLTEDQLGRLLGLAANLVVIDPGFAMLEALAPGVDAAGEPDDDSLVPGCSLPAAVLAGEVSPGGSSYRVGPAAASAKACLTSTSDDADDAFSLVRLDVDGTTVSVVGATTALTNGEILEYGNSAFALNLLGESESLVWYLPSIADVAGAGDAATLTPEWVTPVIALLTITVLAAAFWRGRRFGPLIVENLPVVVRASETMEGRARLYQTGSARLRALDALRMGAIGRLAARCGLPTSATVDEVVLGVATLAGADPREIRSLLVDAEPVSDAEFVTLSDRLLELESTVAEAGRPPR